MKNPIPNKPAFALSILSLCIAQQVYADTNIDTHIHNDVNNSSSNSPMSNIAYSTDMPITTVEAITVVASAKTGTALAQKISEMPAVTQVIDEQALSMQVTGNRTTADILAQLVPSLGTSSGATSNYGMTMHGRPVQFLLNGVPLTSSRNISRELNSIDPAQLERVEVLSGATSIYGAGAAGGLINLVTKTMTGYGFAGESRIGINSARNFDSDSLGYHVGQSLSYGGAQVYGRLDVDFEEKGGAFDSDSNRISPDVYQTDQQDTESLSINANLGGELTDMQSVNLAVTYYKDEQDTDYGPDYGSNLGVLLGGADPSLNAVDGADIANQPETGKTTVNLNYNNADVYGSNLSITGYYKDETGRFYPSGKSVASEAAQIWMANGLTDRATLKRLLPAAVIVAQSEADIEVMGVRAVMQTELNSTTTTNFTRPMLLSYGADYEREESEQTYYEQDLRQFIGSNGLVSTPNGNTYFGGPDTTTDKIGVFINADMDVTDKWHASAGVRYQRIEAETENFVPILDAVLDNYFNNPRIAPISQGYGINYQAGQVDSGSADHDKVLFNVGTSYQINDGNQVFANFSQGLTTADIQRALRDVRAGFVVDSDNVQPIEVNNYELGWQGRFDNSFGATTAKLSGFYNESDKTVRFTDSYTVEVVDTDERVYGAELMLAQDVTDNWQVGGTLAYTRGQYDYDGEWLELDAVRLTPLKGTAFLQYNFDAGSNMRLQATAIDGTDRAYKDQQQDPDNSANAVTGYATVDLLGQVQMPDDMGRVDYGVYNLLNKDYVNVYHQTTYGALNRLPSAGTTYGVSYTIDY